MSTILIIYSTVDGQTKAICDQLYKLGLYSRQDIKMVSLAQASTVNLGYFDKVIIGASIRYGNYRPELFEYVNRQHKALNGKKSAFFSVNVVARKKGKNTPETNPYMNKFIQRSLWKPQQLGVFAGKIDYPSYRFFDRNIILFIMWLTKGPTDTSVTTDFTDWEQVRQFGKAFIDS